MEKENEDDVVMEVMKPKRVEFPLFDVPDDAKVVLECGKGWGSILQFIFAGGRFCEKIYNKKEVKDDKP